MDELDLFSAFNTKAEKRQTQTIPIKSESKRPKSAKSPKDEIPTEQIDFKQNTSNLDENLNNTSKSTLHDVVLPLDGKIQDPWIPNPVPAKTYPFVLDPFQAKSIECLERGESVLVTAHTSAGKTAVAEYAIAMALRDKQRVIYTSPIKALSNQKYRDLHQEFNDVGLMTGDVTISPNASCIVMTTEILRSMLYRGSEILREVAWVIYDEIHYMRDLERGVVWEESIVLLPHKVRYVFLSATIPNGKEFAGWIADVHHQKVHVLYTEFRPTPLQHYLYTPGSAGLYLVLDETGKFREKNFEKAVSSLSNSALEEKTSQKGKKTTTESNLKQIVKLIMDKAYDPVLIFSFSKKECEGYGNVIAQDSYTTKDEKRMIQEVYKAAIDGLSDEDKKLPQVNSMLPLLLSGVGIHHGGLLPILKEIIEILFQEGLLKVLFATETFAMGVNMPARTVVFTSIKKYDGKEFRLLSSGEYIQMSGRAGRRGKDVRGIVIEMLDEKIEPSDVKAILKGKADPLNSSFYLGYNMLLNLMRVEDADPEYIIKNSFYQYQKEQKAPILLNEIQQIQTELSTLTISDETVIGKHYSLNEKFKQAQSELRRVMFQSDNIIQFLQPGRLIRIQHKDNLFDWGSVLQLKTTKVSDSTNPENVTSLYTIDVVLNCDPDSTKENPLPCPSNKQGVYLPVNVLLVTIFDISSIILKVEPGHKLADVTKTLNSALKKIHKQLSLIPSLDPLKDLKIPEHKIKKLLDNVATFGTDLTQFGDIDVHSKDYQNYVNKITLQQKERALHLQVKFAEELALCDQLKLMKRVLRRLEYINDENVVQMKGKVACEINASDELLLTELIFDNVFNELTIPQLCGLLSMLVFEEKSDDNPRVPQDMMEPIKKLQETAKRLGEVLIDAKMELDLDEYVHRYKPAVVDIVYGWAKGESFSQICKKNDNIFEGSVIRCIRREEELLRELVDAAHAIGNNILETKFTESINAIKRDIVFAASLYLN